MSNALLRFHCIDKIRAHAELGPSSRTRPTNLNTVFRWRARQFEDACNTTMSPRIGIGEVGRMICRRGPISLKSSGDTMSIRHYHHWLPTTFTTGLSQPLVAFECEAPPWIAFWEGRTRRFVLDVDPLSAQQKHREAPPASEIRAKRLRRKCSAVCCSIIGWPTVAPRRVP